MLLLCTSYMVLYINYISINLGKENGIDIFPEKGVLTVSVYFILVISTLFNKYLFINDLLKEKRRKTGQSDTV